VQVKNQEASAAHPERHLQFEQVEVQKQRFQAAGWPSISVDTTKKELIGSHLRGTTRTGLTVRATLLEGEYAKGQKDSEAQMEQPNLEHGEVCTQWN
jgi:hypothetical protein